MNKITTPPLLRLIALSLMLVIPNAGAWAGVRAQLDRDKVYIGDTLTLTIETDGQNQGDRPDLSVLDADFRVLGTASGTQIRIINGRRSDTQRWTVVLEPKRIGKLRVPGIHVGSAQTRPLALEVGEVPMRDKPTKQTELFIEMETDTTQGYVQQPITISVRLFSSVPIREGVLSEPRVENARVDQLGESRRYMAERKGRRYRVIERKYVLFPERSGQLQVPPVVFRGSLVASRRSGSGHNPGSPSGGSLFERLRDDPFFSDAFTDPTLDRLFNDDFFQNPFGNPQPGKRVSARSLGLDIEVKPRPDDYRGRHWLPARQLVLTDSWADEPPSFRVGEPVTRTITVRAQGAEGAQIPPLDLKTADGLRVYPERPVSETRTDGERVLGISRQSMAIVPKQAGTLVVPRIEVRWWDTDTRQERTASIAEWRITAEPGSGTQPQPAPPHVNQAQTMPDPAQVAAEPPLAETPGDDSPALLSHPYLPWLGGLGLLVVAALTGWMRWRKTRAKATGHSAYPVKPVQRLSRAGYRAAREAFRKACEADDATEAARTLLVWAADEWPDRPARNLGALAARVDQGADLIRELDRSLYASDTTRWQGRDLWETLQGGLETDRPLLGETDPDLPPLYSKHR